MLAIGFGVGVRFATGLPGVLVFIGFSALWGLVFTGFPYAVALKTGSPAAVNACFVVFFPLFFLTDAVVPKQALTGWFSTIATYNPITYLLGALRSLITSGWAATTLLEGWPPWPASAAEHVARLPGAAGQGPPGRLSARRRRTPAPARGGLAVQASSDVRRVRVVALGVGRPTTGSEPSGSRW